ncbi:MAG TPA: hypothetical protein VKE88_02865 [Candidatus Nanoarchaeia archaeon]|nr:hypothetical protein [Candidatus Nanoarchaeia archaeon]
MNPVDEYTKKFTKETMPNVLQVRRNFFSVSDELMKVKDKVKTEPFAIGTYLGTGNPFKPSIALLDWLNERTERTIMLDKKSAWLFVCGRDVFAAGIMVKEGAFVREGPVIVRNEAREMLGLGELGKSRKIPLKNVMDRGDFLRRERH